MVRLYCRHEHAAANPDSCPDCKQLLAYAAQRMDKCVYGDNKPVCSQCPVHCYKPEMRTKIKKVMRYAGPRMMWSSPILTARYLYRKRYKSKSLEGG